MQRYFVEAGRLKDGTVAITGEDAHHMHRVMRMKPGERIVVSDGAGREAVAELLAVGPSEVTAKLQEDLRLSGEPAWSITVAQGLPKGDKMELVIQKGTEIGAAAFVPFESERAVVQYDERKEQKRLERWRKIAKEAAEQAHRSIIPAIMPVMSWRELLASVPRYDAAFLCYEKEGGSSSAGLRTSVRSLLRERAGGGAGEPAPPLSILLIVGPEGGFAEHEAEAAAAASVRIVGLGKRILRTETAALVGAACLLYEAGEMGGA